MQTWGSRLTTVILNLTFWHFTLVYLRFWMSTALVKINTNHFWPLKMSKIRFMTFKTRFNWIYNWNDKTNIFYKAVYWFQNWKSQKIALWHFELSVVISKKTNWRHLVCFTELVITTQSNTQYFFSRMLQYTALVLRRALNLRASQ